jgi:hypothetical protein
MIVFVKQGNMIQKLDPKDEAVAVFLTEEDKWNIAHMVEGMQVYCMYPEEMDPDTAKQFIRDCKQMEDK